MFREGLISLIQRASKVNNLDLERELSFPNILVKDELKNLGKWWNNNDLLLTPIKYYRNECQPPKCFFQIHL